MVTDGRIHPARIEEVVAKVKKANRRRNNKKLVKRTTM
jgi:hypothetical protein